MGQAPVHGRMSQPGLPLSFHRHKPWRFAQQRYFQSGRKRSSSDSCKGTLVDYWAPVPADLRTQTWRRRLNSHEFRLVVAVGRCWLLKFMSHFGGAFRHHASSFKLRKVKSSPPSSVRELDDRQQPGAAAGSRCRQLERVKHWDQKLTKSLNSANRPSLFWVYYQYFIETDSSSIWADTRGDSSRGWPAASWGADWA